MNSQVNSHGFWRERLGRFAREWGYAIAITVFAVFWIALVGSVWAEAAETPEGPDASEPARAPSSSRSHASASEDDEYSFDWLDTDKKIYVLQNRKFLKASRLELSVMGGIGFSNPYRNTLNLDPRLAFYFSEGWGIEVFYTLTSNSPNSTFQALTTASGTSTANLLPSIREIRSQYGGMVHFVPWYAKINVFNTILHFDWYFGAGGGYLNTYVDTRRNASQASDFTQQNILGLFFSTGHLYHLSNTFDVRLDVTGAFYQAPINGLTGESTWYSNYNFGVGVGLKL